MCGTNYCPVHRLNWTLKESLVLTFLSHTCTAGNSNFLPLLKGPTMTMKALRVSLGGHKWILAGRWIHRHRSCQWCGSTYSKKLNILLYYQLEINFWILELCLPLFSVVLPVLNMSFIKSKCLTNICQTTEWINEWIDTSSGPPLSVGLSSCDRCPQN